MHFRDIVCNSDWNCAPLLV